jgi:transcriptional regulator with XRE-family HTH domain
MSSDPKMVLSTLGARLRHAREQLRLTQKQLADLVTTDATHVSRLEGDHCEPSVAMLRKLARHLRVSTDWLLFGEENSYPTRIVA